MKLKFVKSTFVLVGTANTPKGWRSFGASQMCFDTERARVYERHADDKALRAFNALGRGRAKSYREESNFSPDVPEGMTLFPYQRAGVEMIISRKSTYLADEQGLGKTVQIIASINELKSERTLIICPASLKGNWKNEFLTWSTRKGITIDVVDGGKHKVNAAADVIIVNYDLCHRKDIEKQLTALHFDFVALDEIQYLKNPKAKRTQSILGSKRKVGIITGSKVIVPMSGTPVPNKPVELWPVLSKIFNDRLPLLLREWMEFTRYFCGGFNQMVGGRPVWQTNGSTHRKQLNQILRERIMLRRLKVDVLPQLPDKLFSIIDLNPTREAKSLLTDESEFRDDVVKSLDKAGKLPPLEGLAELRRELAELKVSPAVGFIKDLIQDSDEKVIVFAYHKNVVTALEEGLSDLGTVKITGDVPNHKRAGIVEQFQADGGPRVFIGNLTAAGVGLTLTKASKVVFVESSWVPGENDQCVDRAHRIGQHDCVNAYFLVWSGSLDSYILKRSLEKKKAIAEVLK